MPLKVILPGIMSPLEDSTLLKAFMVVVRVILMWHLLILMHPLRPVSLLPVV